MQFWDTKQNAWSYIITTYAYYMENGIQYPAYCLQPSLPGVGETNEYHVNINQLMSDTRLWRVTINGYPYQTPESMGVSNQYDAFVATKQAIYSILDGRDPSTYYRGGDSRGEAIKNAIVRLVDIGRNGTQTPTNTTISVEKVGEFVEDGDYYAQEYVVNSPVEMSSYTIIGTTGIPNGGIITDMQNVEKTTFGNEHFKVRIPKSEMKQDLDITININAQCKTYPIFYGETTVAGTQDYLLTYDVFGDVAGKVELDVKANTGKIKIIKTDSETNLPISGVTFQLSTKDGTVIANATTDSKGIATFSSLYQGDYVIKEISTDENYIINETPFDVNTEFNHVTEINVTNEHKKGDLKIYKVDKDNNKVVLGNVEFQLYSEEFDKIIGTYNTDVNGELKIEDLRTGNYKLIETKTNQWYNLAEDTEIEVEWDKEAQATIQNELKKGQVRIIKVDEDNNEVRLEGVEFEVLDENNNVLEKLITDENGEALTSRYPIRDFSKLKIRETKTLEEYVLSNEVKTIELEENQITDIVFENEKIKGQVEITKVDKKDNTKLLEGAKFELYDENDNLIETLVTDEQGKAISSEICKGKYYLKEVDTGSVYYLLNNDIFEFEIVNNDEIIPITITNEKVEISVDVEKTGYIETQKNDTIKYDFSNIANTSNIYLDSFKWKDFLPTDYIRLTEIVTGTWNQDITYSITYKTNLNEEERILAENLNSKENHKIDCTNIGLQEGEYITEFSFNFGKVDIGFKEENAPSIFCKVLDTVEDKDTFTNKTKTEGEYEDLKDEENDEWTTVVYEKDIHAEKLPKTGK